MKIGINTTTVLIEYVNMCFQILSSEILYYTNAKKLKSRKIRKVKIDITLLNLKVNIFSFNVFL